MPEKEMHDTDGLTVQDLITFLQDIPKDTRLVTVIDEEVVDLVKLHTHWNGALAFE